MAVLLEIRTQDCKLWQQVLYPPNQPLTQNKSTSFLGSLVIAKPIHPSLLPRASPQFSSSDLSLQSAVPSQTQLRWIHSLLPQWNSREEQGPLTRSEAVSRPPQFCGHSSEPSSQSTSASQAHRLGMHVDELQRKWAGPQVETSQWASSEPSRQSRSPSHRNC